ncbi:MAG: hypothetical protein R3C99_02745 [Pirellulaceae bacterium]
MLLLIAASAIWMGIRANTIRRQQATIAELSKMRVIVHYDHQHDALPPQQLALRGTMIGPIFPEQRTTSPSGPTWLRHLLGDDYFQTPVAVTLFTDDLNDITAVLPLLRKLPRLKEILLCSPSCGNAIPNYLKAKELLEQELPNVTVTGFGIPIVG